MHSFKFNTFSLGSLYTYQVTRAVHTKVKLKMLRITYNGISFSLKVHVNRRYSAIEYSIYNKMTTARFNLILYVLCLSWDSFYLQFKQVSNAQFGQEQGRYACVVFQLLPAAPPPPAPALWRGPPTFDVPQCPAGAARLQCHSDQQLCKEIMTTKILVYLFFLSSLAHDL